MGPVVFSSLALNGNWKISEVYTILPNLHKLTGIFPLLQKTLLFQCRHLIPGTRFLLCWVLFWSMVWRTKAASPAYKICSNSSEFIFLAINCSLLYSWCSDYFAELYLNERSPSVCRLPRTFRVRHQSGTETRRGHCYNPGYCVQLLPSACSDNLNQ